jgi:ABC-type xylose transport system permease subunit
MVILGVLIMGVLTNGMIMMNVNDYVQQLVKGLVLITAVSFDRYQARKSINN